ncbi:MAG TPA: hypothetical protein VGT79_10890 [Xanthomonadaceae bacterium]|nr:hypothetical protein [Xanthomonadaceae bacterium]
MNARKLRRDHAVIQLCDHRQEKTDLPRLFHRCRTRSMADARRSDAKVIRVQRQYFKLEFLRLVIPAKAGIHFDCTHKDQNGFQLDQPLGC